MLVPTAEGNFLATWQEPFDVIEMVEEANYNVRQPGKRKWEQILHVNLPLNGSWRDSNITCLGGGSRWWWTILHYSGWQRTRKQTVEELGGF